MKAEGKSLEQLIDELPPDARHQVKNIVISLLHEAQSASVPDNPSEQLGSERDYWLAAFAIYLPSLFKYALSHTGETVDQAEAILQDVYVHIERYPPRRDKIRSARNYLRQIVRKVASDLISNPLAESLDDPNMTSQVDDLSVQESLETGELLDLLEQHLKSRDKEVFELWRQGQTVEEIARSLSTTVVQVRLSKSRIKHVARRSWRDLDRAAAGRYPQALLDRRLRQNWAGGLADYRNRFTSLGLQKKALEWRD